LFLFFIDGVSDEDNSGSPAQADSQGIPLEAVVSTQENQHESDTVKSTLEEAKLQDFLEWKRARKIARDRLLSDGRSGDLHGESTLEEAKLQDFLEWKRARKIARDRLLSDGRSGDLHGEPIDDVSDEDERGSPREHSGTKCT
jgi:hypothetical protein